MSQGTPYEFVDIMKYVRISNIGNSYNAGGQIQLLADAFDVEWILLDMDGDYQGGWYAIFKMNEKYHLLNGYFGSCSGCDDLKDEDPFFWLESNVKNVRAFESIELAIKWLETTEEYSYISIKNYMLCALRNE